MPNVAALSGQGYEGLLTGPPLRRPRVCSRVCVALIAILAFAGLIHLTLLAVTREDVAVVFFRALGLSSLLSLLPLTLLWLLERRERRAPWLFAAAFLWGGCIATAFAFVFNTAFFGLVDRWVSQRPDLIWLLGPDAPMLLAAPISAPIAEEFVKALGVVVIFWILHAEHDGVRDGIVYGALVGVGFNWFEAALYVAQGYAEYGFAPYGLQLGARYALFGLGGHAMLTGMFGAFFGLALQTRRSWVRVLAPIFGLVLSVTAHMVNNALPLIAAIASIAAGEPPRQGEPPPDIDFLEPFVARTQSVLAVSPDNCVGAVEKQHTERRVIKEELAGEATNIVSPKE